MPIKFLLNVLVSRTTTQSTGQSDGLFAFLKVGLGAFIILLLCVSPSVAKEIRVAIRQNVRTLSVGSSTSAKVKDGLGREIATLPALKGFQADAVSGGVDLEGHRAWQLVIVPESEDGLVYIGDRWYRGKVRLLRTSSGFTAINHVDLDDYLASVIGKEMYTTWPLESLKAQAVASRSYAIYKTKKQKNKQFDLLNTTTSQVYSGIDGEAASTIEAAKSTQGQVITHQGKIIEAVFHSASGGHTENSEHVWMSAVPYLRGVPDFDQNAPVFQWTANFTASQMRQRLPGIGNIKALIPLQKSPTGRIIKMKIQGDAGSQVIGGRQFRKALGLKSTLIQVAPQFGLLAGAPKNVAPNQFSIQGRGYGHGIGMSQWGAHGMASQGKMHQEILNHFYPGTIIQSIPE